MGGIGDSSNSHYAEHTNVRYSSRNGGEFMTRKYNTQHPKRGRSHYPDKNRGRTMPDLETLQKRQKCKVKYCGQNNLLCGHNREENK